MIRRRRYDLGKRRQSRRTLYWARCGADFLERIEIGERITVVTRLVRNWWMRGAAACGLGALVLLGAPGAAWAQAGPGPIRPAPGSQGDSTGAPRAAVDEPKPPDRKDLWGSWKLDVAQSDDAMEQIKEAKTTGAVGSPRNGGGNGGGGNPNGNGTGIHMGGGASPFPGGNGSAPRKSGSADDDFNHQQMQELTNPAGLITLSALDTKEDKGAEVDYSDDRGRKRVFYTDGRKFTKSTDDKFQEYNSHWEDYRLVSDVEGAHDARATRSFEPAPGGEKLIEFVRLERTKSHDLVEIRYVYDKVAGSAPKQSSSAAGPVLRPTDPAPVLKPTDPAPSLKSADGPPVLDRPTLNAIRRLRRRVVLRHRLHHLLLRLPTTIISRPRNI